jgi:hypothetical protein
MRIASWGAVALSVALVAGGSARAETSLWAGERALAVADAPDGLFVTAGTEVAVQHLPRWNSPASLFRYIITGNRFLSNFSPDPVVTETGITFGLGHAFKEGALPSWAGTRVRIALVGGFSAGGGRHTVSSL